MMYGVGLPILFPIACASLILMYMMDLYMIFYVYRKPPDYDTNLHDSQLKQMEAAVFIFLAFGVW